MTVLALDAIRLHRFGLAGREPPQIARAQTRFDPTASQVEVLRRKPADLLGRRHDLRPP